MQLLTQESQNEDQYRDLKMTKMSHRNFNVSEGVTIKL